VPRLTARGPAERPSSAEGGGPGRRAPTGSFALSQFGMSRLQRMLRLDSGTVLNVLMACSSSTSDQAENANQGQLHAGQPKGVLHHAGSQVESVRSAPRVIGTRVFSYRWALRRAGCQARGHRDHLRHRHAVGDVDIVKM